MACPWHGRRGRPGTPWGPWHCPSGGVRPVLGDQPRRGQGAKATRQLRTDLVVPAAQGATPGYFPIMTMHPLSRTVPSLPSTRRNRSKFRNGPVRSNSTAPAPPADVVSVATVPKLVLVQTPSAGASTARVIVKVVFGAASWMLTLTWATKVSTLALVGETMTCPFPAPSRPSVGFVRPSDRPAPRGLGPESCRRRTGQRPSRGGHILGS
jgi:hypothetical protein